MKHQFLFRVLVTHYVSKSGVSFVQDIKEGEKSGLECEFHFLLHCKRKPMIMPLRALNL